jgi:hypothetical protein
VHILLHFIVNTIPARTFHLQIMCHKSSFLDLKKSVWLAAKKKEPDCKRTIQVSKTVPMQLYCRILLRC